MDKHMSKIEYKSIITTGKSMSSIPTTEEKVETFLLNEHKANRSWSQLDKISRIDRLNNYADKVGTEKNMDDKSILELKTYFKTLVDKKKLLRSKEVIYDKKTDTVLDVPLVIIRENGKKYKYSLKRVDNRQSTLKNLAPRRKLKRKKKDSK
jgi:hypothetical protein